MSAIPAEMLERRRELSWKFLSGNGVEIGALHHPMALGPRARVRYVDRYDAEGLRRHYPELGGYDLVPVDAIDDGETLSTFKDGELDFIIANHFLEHTENPIGTIRNHLGKLRRGGRLYFAVPNKHDSFDRGRATTAFVHLINDDRDGPQGSRAEHFREWVGCVGGLEDPSEIEDLAQRLMAINYSIHYHVWDARAFSDFLNRTRSLLGNAFDIEHFSINGSEIVAVLRKRDPVSTRRRSPLALKAGERIRFARACLADWRRKLRSLRRPIGPNPARPPRVGARGGAG